MVEPPPEAHGGGSEAGHAASPPLPAARLAIMIVPTAVVDGAASVSAFLAQTTGLLTVVSVTVLVAALTCAEAAGAALASRLPAASAWTLSRLAACGVVIAIAAVCLPPLMPVAALVLAFLAGVAQPLRAAAIQRAVSDGIRARAASAASACDMATRLVLLPLAGVWHSRRR